jgi:hypothetical protein
MEFVQGEISLDDISGGTLGAGVIPLARMLRAEEYAENVADVTVTAGGTEIVALSSMTLVAGDRVLVMAQFDGLKGAVNGGLQISINKWAGTAVGVFAASLGSVFFEQYIGATKSVGATLVGFWRCTTGGTATFSLRGVSEVSDFECPALMCEIHAIALIGA